MEHRNLNCDDRKRRLCRFSKHNYCCNQQNMKLRPTKCGMGMLWRTGCNISWLASISRLGLGSWPMFFAFDFVVIPILLMRSPHVLVAEYPHFGQTVVCFCSLQLSRDSRHRHTIHIIIYIYTCIIVVILNDVYEIQHKYKALAILGVDPAALGQISLETHPSLTFFITFQCSKAKQVPWVMWVYLNLTLCRDSFSSDSHFQEVYIQFQTDPHDWRERSWWEISGNGQS